MGSPFFSIVIPTRNRHETLQYAIRTVLDQDFTDYELLIADNSDPESLDQAFVLDPFRSDNRFLCLRPDSVLSMSDNWEFAISKTTGKYVILFGDDDGLVAGALSKIHGIIQETRARLVSWIRVEYSWPDRTPLEYSNLTVIPTLGKTGLIDSARYIREIVHQKGDYRLLPMFYNSAVSQSLIAELREKTGRVFNASSPDIYTGYAFAHLQKEYLTIGYPLSINGVSSKSNGAAHLNADESVKADYWKLMKRSDIKWPEWLPALHEPYLAIVEPYIQLSRFFPELRTFISHKEIYKIIIDHLEAATREQAEQKLQLIRECANSDPNLGKWAEGYTSKAKPVISREEIRYYAERIGFGTSHLVLDASKFGVANVHQLSEFLGNLFGDLKNRNFQSPIYPALSTRIKKAAGVILKPL